MAKTKKRKIQRSPTIGNPRNVELVDRGKVLNIVGQTSPDRTFSEDVLSELEKDINWAIAGLIAPFKSSEIPDVSQIRDLLKKLNKQLTPTRSWFLEAIGREYQRRHDPVRGYLFLDDSIRDNVQALSQSSKAVLSWLQDDVSIGIVSRSLKPAQKSDEVVAKDLPAIFKKTFGEECGVGRSGAGPRFIVAVLRATGIRTTDEPDDKIAEAVKKARERYAARINKT